MSARRDASLRDSLLTNSLSGKEVPGETEGGVTKERRQISHAFRRYNVSGGVVAVWDRRQDPAGRT